MATKGTNKKQQFSIDILMGEYATWLEKKVSEKSIPKYKAVDVFFKCDSFRGQKMTNQERNFMELLPKLIGKTKTNIEFKNDRTNVKAPPKNGPQIIGEIIKGITNAFFNNKSLQNKTKTESNYQSYAKKFFEFIVENYIKAKTEDSKDKCKEYNYPPLSAGDQAVLSGKEGELYLPNILRTKFKSRLRCQDRTSGDKIWLPLRFIGKIYSEAKKANKNNDENNLFLEWLDNLVKSIYIHYYKDPNSHQVESIQFNDNVSLWLRRNEDEDDYFDVYVNTNTNSLNDYCPVLTPTGKGNQKIQMTVKSISDIAIDHVKSIDSTLRDLSENPNELPLLTIVSNKYKEIQMEDEPNEKAAINELLKSEIFDLKALKKELDNISNDGILRLMSSKYNSKKSNGETFQSIIKCSEEYWGIVEKEEIIIDENDNRVYLMQNLTNTLNDKNIFRVKKTLPQGTEIKDRKDLIEIINYI